MSHRNKAVLCMLLSIASAIGGFVSLFQGKTNHIVAFGMAVICFTGFYLAIEQAFKQWDAYQGNKSRREFGG